MNAMCAAESGCCMRNCCGPARGFVMHVTDNYEQVTIHCASVKKDPRFVFAYYFLDQITASFDILRTKNRYNVPIGAH